MRTADIIAKKRDGLSNSKEEIEFLIQGCAKQSIPDYQVSAWLMAAYLCGMSMEETAILTRAMIHSGSVITFDTSFQHLLVDKHSTGGVGDKISLPLAPIAAAMGLHVPMISGRALGITGGTLDKLESMPGYSVHLSEEEFKKTVMHDGYAMCAQTENLVPADRILYSLRDVTATVESIPLITASILSKKIAEGARALILDVKCGSGAFMKTFQQAQALGESLSKTASLMGIKTSVLITDMNEPLGMKVGNFLEIEETVDLLTGPAPEDVLTLVLTQAAYMAKMAGLVSDIDSGKELARKQIGNGKALELWWKNVKNQGADPTKVEVMLRKERAPYSAVIHSETSGYLQICAQVIGQAGVILGVGRNQKTDTVSPTAGFIFACKSGTHVLQGRALCTVYAPTQQQLEQALKFIKDHKGFTTHSEPIRKPPLILQEISA